MQSIQNTMAQGENEMLELIQGEREITRAAILLFGKNPQSPFSQAVVHAGRLRGTVQIVDDRFIRGSVIDQIDESLDFIKKHLNVKSVISGKSQRDDVWDYPLSALREVLTNVVCHREYGDLGDIQIKIHDQSLQIWSPGFLPFGMTVEELLRPNHSSKPRNRLIAQAFYDMGMIEQYGSGIERVIEACVLAGLPEPEFENFSGGFQVVFHASSMVAPQVAPQVAKLLAVMKGEMDRETLQKAVGLQARKNFRLLYLTPALKAGFVEMTIPDKPNSRLQKYRLTAKGGKVVQEMDGS